MTTKSTVEAVQDLIELRSLILTNKPRHLSISPDDFDKLKAELNVDPESSTVTIDEVDIFASTSTYSCSLETDSFLKKVDERIAQSEFRCQCLMVVIAIILSIFFLAQHN